MRVLLVLDEEGIEPCVLIIPIVEVDFEEGLLGELVVKLELLGERKIPISWGNDVMDFGHGIGWHSLVVFLKMMSYGDGSCSDKDSFVKLRGFGGFWARIEEFSKIKTAKMKGTFGSVTSFNWKDRLGSCFEDILSRVTLAFGR